MVLPSDYEVVFVAFESVFWPIIAVVSISGFVVFVLLYATRISGKKTENPPENPLEFKEMGAFQGDHTVTNEEAKSAKDEVRTLDLEREILSDAIRRLYEAHIEGKINEEERDKLAQRYKSRMMTVKNRISGQETTLALHELEAMRSDLIKLFSDRFDNVNKKINEFRSRLDIKPVEAPSSPPIQSKSEVPLKKEKIVRKRPKAPEKTGAEKRIEEIKEEVEKVLERLGQIEVES